MKNITVMIALLMSTAAHAKSPKKLTCITKNRELKVEAFAKHGVVRSFDKSGRLVHFMSHLKFSYDVYNPDLIADIGYTISDRNNHVILEGVGSTKGGTLVGVFHPTGDNVECKAEY